METIELKETLKSHILVCELSEFKFVREERITKTMGGLEMAHNGGLRMALSGSVRPVATF